VTFGRLTTDSNLIPAVQGGKPGARANAGALAEGGGRANWAIGRDAAGSWHSWPGVH
jgi:hypothetical protein